MKESIGLTATLNIVIIFLFIAFAFILGTMSYSKAFRASSMITNALERYEGYNLLSKHEIDRNLNTLGYMSGNGENCPKTRTSSLGVGELVTLDEQQYKEYCIYFFDNDGDKRHYSYGIVTYITFEFNVFGMTWKFPIYNHVRRIYRFNVKRS